MVVFSKREESGGVTGILTVKSPPRNSFDILGDEIDDGKVPV